MCSAVTPWCLPAVLHLVCVLPTCLGETQCEESVFLVSTMNCCFNEPHCESLSSTRWRSSSFQRKEMKRVEPQHVRFSRIKPCKLFLHGKKRRTSSIFRHSASRVSAKSRWQEKRVFRSAHIEYKFHFIYSHQSVIHQETAGSRGHIFMPLFISWRDKCNNGFGKTAWCLKRNHIHGSTSFFFAASEI